MTFAEPTMWILEGPAQAHSRLSSLIMLFGLACVLFAIHIL